MLETLRSFMPAWLFALILVVVSLALSALAQYLAGGDWANIVFAVLSSLVGVGVGGVKAVAGKPTSQPEVTP